MSRRGSWPTILLAGVILSIGVTFPAAAAADGPVIVSPAPGTPDASPQTQISILGEPKSKIASVSVVGADSGKHGGKLQGYSANRGASFILDQPLTEGENVDVRIGFRGRGPLSFSFTVAIPGLIQPVLNLPFTQPDKLNHYVSRPELLPPKISVYKRSPGTRGDIFLTPLPSPIIHPENNNSITIHPVGPGGPMIIDRNGRLVWFHQLEPPNVAANFRPQRFLGQRVLTWWQGGVTPSAIGLGEGVIADTSYKILRTVHAGNGYQADIHEFRVTNHGDAFITVYSPIKVHLPGTAPGSLSPMLDALVQEIDVRTGLVVWEWHAYGHIPLADSYANPENSANYDAYHINSIQPLSGGRVLISARDTWAVYMIKQAGSKIAWTLGGKASDFHFGPGAHFYFQHDARLLSHGRVSVFDDEGGPPNKSDASRGLVLKLDRRRHTADVQHQYLRPDGALAQSEGSLQLSPWGTAFVGFGSSRFFSEFALGGNLLFDASLPVDDGSYRMFRARWSATPTTRPDLVVQPNGPSGVSAYASWNGATGVARWQLLAGPDASSLVPVSSAPRNGFETRLLATSGASKFRVRALARDGHVLAASAVVSTAVECRAGPLRVC